MIPPGVETLLAVALLSELRDQLGARSDDFLVAVGEKIGEACALDAEGDTGQLARWMNGIWAELGMGSVSLMPGARRLEIAHRLPMLPPEAVLWRDALPFVIEGVYRSWFHSMDPRGVLGRAARSGSELKFVYSD
ncbi:MAG: Cellulose synthase subunit, partial [Brevundimonas sp.]|nr:Cellulose synthase subunit [Brevundimonas sp.]